MHTPELGQKLKHLEKLIGETEKVAKKYLGLTGKCPTELDDDDKVVIPFDEQLYTKLIKVYHEATAIFTKDEAAIDACLEKVTELQRGTGSGSVGGKNANYSHANSSSSNAPANSLNPNVFNTQGNPITGGGKAGDAGGKRRGLKDPESPAKKKRMTKKGVPSVGSPPPPTYVANVGDLAAARAPNSDQWILVRITGYNQKSGRYEVEDDAPDEEEPMAKKFVCAPSNIVLLPPDPASINLAALQPPNSIGSLGPVVYLWYPIPAKLSVLAMFPQTTTFYPAKVVTHQKRNKIVQSYLLHFDDDQEGGATPDRRVNAQYVIPLPKDF